MRARTMLPALAVLPAVALVLAGCSGSGSTAAADDGTIRIVASTNVYGDIAAAIGGDDVEVTSLITSAAQDPHSYEASAQDQLAIKKADVVIENGGGYDPFIDTLLDAAKNTSVEVVNVVDLSGLAPEDDHSADDHTEDAHSDDDGHDHIEGFNEHVWYSLPTMAKLADQLAEELGELDSANAASYTANAKTFTGKLATIETAQAAVKTAHDGEGVAITEPVPLYLLEGAGLVNRTPEAFSEAIEEGTDVSPTVLKETLDLFDAGTVALLAYNEQTSGAETEQVKTAAENAGVPVLSFTETLPDGQDYLSWMTENVDAVADALDR
ncbi:MAG TPA: zinc ABC transporter substrate-binding protein [Plantibacter sp.]|uniref:metal ABC transporter solute-binding protein, Zn/Mn family n=1 Tax=unclassified Plantibacter TaxID=2624265 RepID=UPI002C33CED5|nr:zinc ABC transporter substrate-binding protein [Plantibacter sp.]